MVAPRLMGHPGTLPAPNLHAMVLHVRHFDWSDLNSVTAIVAAEPIIFPSGHTCLHQACPLNITPISVAPSKILKSR